MLGGGGGIVKSITTVALTLSFLGQWGMGVASSIATVIQNSTEVLKSL